MREKKETCQHYLQPFSEVIPVVSDDYTSLLCTPSEESQAEFHSRESELELQDTRQKTFGFIQQWPSG